MEEKPFNKVGWGEAVVCNLAVYVRTSALFDKTPYFRIEVIVIGALHAVDLGVSQGVLGNVFTKRWRTCTREGTGWQSAV